MRDLSVLVVGYGSIGTRHVRILEELGYSAAVVSRRNFECPRRYATVLDALESELPDYVVIANRTSEHYETVKTLALAGYTGRVLVEKPLFHHLRPVPEHRFARSFVGYNLRFHPVIQRLRGLLEWETAISAQVYVGLYLPEWRPDRDYRNVYSARKSEGGGALRDLSHELDYVSWLFRGWIRLTALGGKLGDLEIDTDDVFAVLVETQGCPVVTVQMNYLDRVFRREILVNTISHTFRANLIKGTVQIDGGPVEEYDMNRDTTYLAQHRAALRNSFEPLATLEDGVNVLRMIAAAEKAARDGGWVSFMEAMAAP